MMYPRPKFNALHETLDCMCYDSFSLNLIPSILKETILDIHSQVQSPIELISASVFSAISLACQGLIDVSYRENCISPTSLFILAIAGSGERKSATDRLIMAPFYRYDQNRAECFRHEMDAYKVAHIAWAEKKKHIMNKMKTAIKNELPCGDIEQLLLEHENNKPLLPKLTFFINSNVTMEALLSGLRGEQATAGLITDEGGDILERRAIQDLSSLNLLWDGSSLTVNRKTTGTFTVNNARTTLSIMVQPDIFGNYLSRHGEKARGSGFFARLLPVLIDGHLSTQGSRLIKGTPAKQEALNRFHQRITSLLSENATRQGNVSSPRITMTFSPGAQYDWNEQIYNAIEKQMLPGERFHGISDFASKLPNNIARLAALFEYFTTGSTVISQDTLQQAYRVGMWFANQALHLYQPDSENFLNRQLAFKLMNWLSDKFRHQLQPSMPISYILGFAPRPLRRKAILDPVLKLLLSSNHLYARQISQKSWLIEPGCNFDLPLVF